VEIGEGRLISVLVDMGARVKVNIDLAATVYLHRKFVPHAIHFLHGAADQGNFIVTGNRRQFWKRSDRGQRRIRGV
jgi:hypothetical protein